MGNCCSTLEDNGGKAGYLKATPANLQLPTLIAPQQQRTVDKRGANWQSTGIIGLRDAKLKSIPDKVVDVGTAAKVLDAGNNSLTSLPVTLTALVNLQRIVLSNNQLTGIPGPIMAAVAGSLKVLDISGNAVTALPDEIGSLTRLEKLLLTKNQLTSLPATINRCCKLTHLAVGSNRLSCLPDHLPAELEEVDAADNRIPVIPVGLRSLTKLKILTLDNNSISDVPAEVLADCVSLHTLSLHGNPITADTLQANPAFADFEQRRQQKYSKAIQGGVLLGKRGLDEGIDRNV